MISGNAQAFSVGKTDEAVRDVELSAHWRFDESVVLGRGATDSRGNYRLEVAMPGGQPFDGFLKATKPDFVTTWGIT